MPWQARSGNWDRQTMIDDIARGLRTLEEIIGQPVTCSAAAGWRADQQVIEAKEAFHLRYNSDCRGHAVPSTARIRKPRHCANSGDLTHGMK